MQGRVRRIIPGYHFQWAFLLQRLRTSDNTFERVRANKLQRKQSVPTMRINDKKLIANNSCSTFFARNRVNLEPTSIGLTNGFSLVKSKVHPQQVRSSLMSS